LSRRILGVPGRWAAALLLSAVIGCGLAPVRQVWAQTGSQEAAPVNEARAQEIRVAIERWLLDMFPPTGLASQPVALFGQVVVEPFRDRYAVTLPEVVIDLGGGERLQVGTIAVSLKPTGPVTFDVSARLPLPFSIWNQEDEKLGEFQVKNQRIRGSWDSRVQTLTSIDATLEGLEYVDPGGAVLFRLASATLKGNSEVDEMLRLSGPTSLDMAGFEILDPRGARLLAADDILIETEARGMDMIAYQRFSRRFQSLAEAFIPAPDGALPDRETTDLLLEQLRTEMAGLPALFADAGFSVSAKNVVANSPATSSGYELADIEFSLVGRDMDTNTGTLSATYSHKGFGTLPKPPAPDLTPSEAEVLLDVVSIPNSKLWDVLVQLPNDMSVYGREDGFFYSVEKLIYTLAEAGTEVRIRNSYMNSGGVDARFSATALFDNGAAYKMVAGINIRLIGLDELITVLQAGPIDNPMTSQMAFGLQLLQGFGRRGDPIAGRSNLEYGLKIESDGTTTVNDTEVSSVIDAFISPPAAPQ